MKQCFKFLEATKHFYKNPKNIYKKILKSLEATEPFYKKKNKIERFSQVPGSYQAFLCNP